MKIKKGRDKLVFVFPQLGIAIKFARIHLLRAFITFFGDMIHLNFKWTYRRMNMSIDLRDFEGYPNLLLCGIVNNWREFRFFYKTKHPFLQPTYFSFLGLFNIQKVSKICLVEQNSFKVQIRKITNNEAGYDHHFSNPANFCFDNGKLKIFDYGNKEVQETIINYGSKILKDFDQKT